MAKTEFDKEQFESIMKQDLDLRETADLLGVAPSTLRSYCLDHYSKTPLEVQKDLLRFGKELKNLCLMQCTVREIKAFLEIDDRALDRRCQKEYGKPFKEVFNDFKALGKASLRRIQFKLAEKNAAMAIFLGKNYLQQTDRPEETKTIFDTEALQTEQETQNNDPETTETVESRLTEQ